MTTATLLLIGLLLTGCATIVNGRSQTIPIRSNPPGADVTIRGVKAVTPAEVTLVRQETYDITFKKDGYPERRVDLKSEPSWWLAGNLLFGGFIGLIIDAATGSGFVLAPDSVDIDLASGTVKSVPSKHEQQVQSAAMSPSDLERLRQERPARDLQCRRLYLRGGLMAEHGAQAERNLTNYKSCLAE